MLLSGFVLLPFLFISVSLCDLSNECSVIEVEEITTFGEESREFDVVEFMGTEAYHDVVPQSDLEENFFFSLDQHWYMLNDVTRNQQYEEAIRRVVNENSIVLDLGAGTGLLSLYAARAGAKRVWAIERNPETAKLAEQIIKTNDKWGVIQLIRIRSQELKYDPQCKNPSTDWCIPEKANVLISETLGTDVHGEYWMGSLLDVRNRGLLTPDAVIIPSSLSLYSQALWSAYGMPEENIHSGFDYSAMAPLRTYHVEEQDLSTVRHQNLSDVILMTTFDYQTATHLNTPSVPGVWPGVVVTTKATESGWLNSMVVWWVAELTEGVFLSTQRGCQSAWQQKIIIFPNSEKIENGENIDLALVHNGHYYFGIAQPTSLRSERTYLIINNWQNEPLKLHWGDESGRPVSLIPQYKDDDEFITHVEITTPGTIAKIEGHEEINLQKFVNFWYVDRDGFTLFIPEIWEDSEHNRLDLNENEKEKIM
jgi:hypothetical protein